jgi:hypothetical protein
MGCVGAAISFVAIREIILAITGHPPKAISFWDWASQIVFLTILMSILALPFFLAARILAQKLQPNHWFYFLTSGAICGMAYFLLAEYISESVDFNNRRSPLGERLYLLLPMFIGSGAMGGFIFWLTGIGRPAARHADDAPHHPPPQAGEE